MDANTQRRLERRIEELEEDMVVLRAIIRTAIEDERETGGVDIRSAVLRGTEAVSRKYAAAKRRFGDLATFKPGLED